MGEESTLTDKAEASMRFVVENLIVQRCIDRAQLGAMAARAVSENIRESLDEKGTVSIVFAAAPSQSEFLEALRGMEDIDWSRVTAFHLDEYIGIPRSAPQNFAKFLDDHLFNIVRPGKVYYLDGNTADLDAECERYAQLLQEHGLDIACLGIGENGHLAFNDPPTADFADPKWVKVVELDEMCRQQQVNDGAFPSVDEVPRIALTMTIPAMMAARRVYSMVPGQAKQQAVRNTLEGPISTVCPATVLRRHLAATLFIDRDSAQLWESSRSNA